MAAATQTRHRATRVLDTRAPAGALELQVESVTPAADGVLAITLRDPSGRRLPDWAPGAHIDLVLPGGLVRQYSLCGDRWDSTRYRVGVLREDAGRGGSVWVHDTLRPGDLLEIGGPRNTFPLRPAGEYQFVAGGIGITPLLPMIDQAERLDIPWRLIYTGRSRARMAFLDDLARYGERVVVVPRDEQPRVDLERLVSGLPADARVYACGPGGLLSDLAGHFAGSPPGHLHMERFEPEQPVGRVDERSFEVELRRTGATVQVGADESVVDAVRRAGASVLTSCERGVCGTCETTVLEGTPDHRDSLLDPRERAAGDCMFVCVSRSADARLVLDL